MADEVQATVSLARLRAAEGHAVWANSEAYRLRTALTVLVEHIERIAYRDTAGLRLGDTVPQFEQAKEALDHGR